MKTGTACLVLALLVLAPLASGQNAPNASQANLPYKVGATVAANLKMNDIFGKEHSMKDLRGKVVFIHFWSIVCPYEQVAEPKCKNLQKEFGNKGVVQFAINANQRELKADGNTPYANLQAHVKKAEVNFPVLVDPGNKITDMFGAKTTPHCFVIDQKGVLRYAGALDDDPRGNKGDAATYYVRDAIAALLAEKPVPVATSRPYG